MKKKESLIHVKIDYDELVPGKKQILSLESNLIRIIQIIKRYERLRLKELRLKASVARRLKEAKKGLNKLGKELPKLEIPEILEDKMKELEKELHPKKKGLSTKKRDNLQAQLEEIRAKLRRLERMQE